MKSKTEEMTPGLARDFVVKWLRDGGEPNETIPYRYSFTSAVASEDGCLCCAGAAMGHLLGVRGAREVGMRFFGSGHTFFVEMTTVLPEGEVEDLMMVAEWLWNLPITEEAR